MTTGFVDVEQPKAAETGETRPVSDATFAVPPKEKKMRTYRQRVVTFTDARDYHPPKKGLSRRDQHRLNVAARKASAKSGR